MKPCLSVWLQRHVQAEEVIHNKAVLQRKSRVCVRGEQAQRCAPGGGGGALRFLIEDVRKSMMVTGVSRSAPLTLLSVNWDFLNISSSFSRCVCVYEAVCSGGKGQLWRCFTPAGTPAALAPPCGTLYCAFEDTASHTS